MVVLQTVACIDTYEPLQDLALIQIKFHASFFRIKAGVVLPARASPNNLPVLEGSSEGLVT
jgi:hypothetical protein